MAIALIADAHLGGPGGPPEPLLAQLSELRAQGCERLILLGDMFQAWVGLPQFETAEIRAVVSALKALKAQGLRLDYIEGNRDFFLARSYRDLFSTLGKEVAFAVDGVRYLAVHGDGLNDRDRQYLFWRWLSKSAPSRFLVGRIPHRLAQRTIHSTERRLSLTNFKHKVKIPEDAILRYAQKRFAEGYDVLYLGHFHEPRTWKIAGGEVRLLDAWFNHHHLEWLGSSSPLTPARRAPWHNSAQN